MSKVTRRKVLKAAAGATVLAAGAAPAMAEDRQPDDKWRAWAVTDGKHTRLVVEGIYGTGGMGLVAVVSKADPQGINPKILLLDLKLANLPGVWPRVIVPIPAYHSTTPYAKDQYTSVQIRYPHGGSVTIDKIIDAGTGPT